MYGLLFFVLCVLFCREIELVNSADELDFWTRYPEIQGKPTSIQDTKIHRYSIVKRTKTSKKPIKYINSSRTTKATRYVSWRVKNDKKSTSPHRTSHALLHNNVQNNKRFYKKTTRQKEQKYHFRNSFKSTRMTPSYPMQEDDKSKEASVEENFAFSPYSIKQEMLKLARDFPDANISVEVIGRTVSYKDIVILKVAEKKRETKNKYFRTDENKYIDEVPEKKIVFIVHGLSVMGISKIDCFKNEREFKKLLSYYFTHLDKFDIFIVPMANPDGFNSNIKQSVWNKNMSPQVACFGVSLDRNFDVAWNHSHAISSCSQHYPGPFPFSEPETKAIKDVLHSYSHKIIAYFHVHAGSPDVNTYKVTIETKIDKLDVVNMSESYRACKSLRVSVNYEGDAILYPKGYSEVQSDDDKYVDLRGEIDEAMRNASFQVMSVTVDTLYSWYGRISGSSVDYASTVFGIPHAMELVMQSYEPNEYGTYALEKIWKPVIDVIFSNIWRSIKNNDVK